MNEIKIHEFVTREGELPFSKWLKGLRDPQARARILVRLDRLRSRNPGDHKFIGEDLLEFRITYGPGYRIYLGRDGTCLVVLLGGGDKASQSKDIATAKKRWSDYRSRNDGEESGFSRNFD